MLDRTRSILDPARIGGARLRREVRFSSELFGSGAPRDAFEAQGLRVFGSVKAKAPEGPVAG